MSAEYQPTADEVRDWRILRERAWRDAGDNAPMRRVSYAAAPGRFGKVERVIPWLEALNLELD